MRMQTRRALVLKFRDPEVPIEKVGHWVTFTREYEFPESALGLKIPFYGENERVIAEGMVRSGVIIPACSTSSDCIEYEVEITSRLSSQSLLETLLKHLERQGWNRRTD